MPLSRPVIHLFSRRQPQYLRRMTTLTTTVSTSLTSETRFHQARFIPPDAIFALTAEYLQDAHPQKVNLGQGTYRDGDGQPWVLPSVNRARETLSAQGLNHEYLPILGLQTFREATADAVLGSELFAQQKSKVCTLSAREPPLAHEPVTRTTPFTTN